MPTTIDPTIKALASTIGELETGPNATPDTYTKKGASGEFGRYQFMPDTYKNYAQKYLGDANAQPTVENQNKIAYSFVEDKKKAGYNPAQIMSMWNAGEGKPNAYKEGWKGVNAEGVAYDTPAYVQKGSAIYQQKKQQETGTTGGFNPNPYSNPTGNPGGVNYGDNKPAPAPTQDNGNEGFVAGVGSDLSKRLSEGSTALTGAASAALKGDVGGAASGLLQTAGAAGAAVGDVTNRALEVIPGVKQLEGLLGQGVGYLASTPTGQSVAKAIGDFSTAHPELAKDIGAGFNIVTAIPILRGLGVVKNLAGDAAAQALKGVAEKGALKDMTTAASRTVGGRTALARNPDALKTIIDERAIPDVTDGKYDVTDARTKLGDAISNVEDNELQPTLAKANSPAVSARIPLEQYKKAAMQDAVDQLKDTGPVEKYFERLHTKYGDYPTLQQMNEAKRLVSKNISEAGFNSPTYTTDKIVRSSLQKSVEDGAKALGLDDVAAINQKMARLIKAQDMLDYIDRKPVNTGVVGGLIKDVATGAGEIAGNSTGLPLIGAYAGREAGGRVAKSLSAIKTGVLNRTGKDAVRTSLKTAAKKATKGVLYTQAQKATKSR